MFKSKNSYSFKNIIVILSITVASCLLFWFSELITGPTVLKAILSNIGAALLISGVVTAVSEYYTKDNLVEMIFKKLKLKEDIQKTGIDETLLNISEVDYGYYIKKAKSNIDVFHTYGGTWTRNNHDHFVNRLLNSNCKIRVFLMSPNSKFLPALAHQYGITSDELKAKIEEVKKLWEEIYEKKDPRRRKATQSELKLYFHESFPSRSIYRIDDQVIVVDTRIMKGRSNTLPTLICSDTKKKDDFYDYYVGELDQLVQEAEEQSLRS
ncbi:hypothetical protein IK7_01103 [Bacillus cereus VD156]|uniref:hypothetical protein n=1 Tax=Bacillus cereus group TaxID=86661 RepID=UPI000279C312|nr:MULTISPECIES: hypothetical protein [Bacillus cereus group]EJR86593.1 hypothetical protein IK7_01103 [Bacillus cereus VD156]KXY18268.1 hypothetical protein AT259_20595 [Bacillus cereus]PEZ41334.1 hypothetical protein CN346_00080 [Bacillus thuringiensis]